MTRARCAGDAQFVITGGTGPRSGSGHPAFHVHFRDAWMPVMARRLELSAGPTRAGLAEFVEDNCRRSVVGERIGARPVRSTAGWGAAGSGLGSFRVRGRVSSAWCRSRAGVQAASRGGAWGSGLARRQRRSDWHHCGRARSRSAPTLSGPRRFSLTRAISTWYSTATPYEVGSPTIAPRIRR